MTVGTEGTVASLYALEPGTHLCAFHRSPDQLPRIASTFVGHGLPAGDRMLCVTTVEHVDLIAREHDALAPETATRPLARFFAIHEPWGLRISGEVDVSNRDTLLQVLRARASVTPRLDVDLEDLTFADVGSLARVWAVAASLPETGWLNLRRVPDAIRRTLTLSGLRHERLRLEP